MMGQEKFQVGDFNNLQAAQLVKCKQTLSDFFLDAILLSLLHLEHMWC